MTRLHLVNGFLGSGKTTAIVEAARQHMARGERVGVVTNDQGRYLVDTAFVRAEQIPVVQVTGGCFCCAYDQLLDVLTALNDDARPDVVYAESVGSCADLISAVVTPLTQHPDLGVACQSLSVFADSRLLLRLLRGLPLPFGDDVLYIIDRQIEEAGVLVLNKADLLDEASLATLEQLARERLPGRPLLSQNSLIGTSVGRWMDLIEGGAGRAPDLPVQLDYGRYGQGETQLAWVDRTLTASPSGDGRMAVIALIGAIGQMLEEQRVPVARVKFHVSSPSGSAKVSLAPAAPAGWQGDIPTLNGPIQVLLNVRVQMDSRLAGALLDRTISESAMRDGMIWQCISGDTFAPEPPRPPS
ncbi:MAG: GTP-binding protein [Anaerolineae bacterium]